MDIEKMIQDAKAIINGDTSREDILETRILDAACDSAEVIRDIIHNDDRISSMDPVKLLAGLAYLVGALNCIYDKRTGTPEGLSLKVMESMMLCGYQITESNY